MISTLISLLEYVDQEIMKIRQSKRFYISSLKNQAILRLPLQDVKRLELLLKIQSQKEKLILQIIVEVEKINELYDQCVQLDTQVKGLQNQLLDVHKLITDTLSELPKLYRVTQEYNATQESMVKLFIQRN